MPAAQTALPRLYDNHHPSTPESASKHSFTIKQPPSFVPPAPIAAKIYDIHFSFKLSEGTVSTSATTTTSAKSTLCHRHKGSADTEQAHALQAAIIQLLHATLVSAVAMPGLQFFWLRTAPPGPAQGQCWA